MFPVHCLSVFVIQGCSLNTKASLVYIKPFLSVSSFLDNID
jgi:hypothetical protein